ncbi:hypothetical protein EOM82_00230 [bacterium]|nr:hypothetical protein [bacterium]
MKKDKLFFTLIISAIAVAVLNLAALATIIIRIWFFTQNTIFVTPFIFTVFIIVASLNGALIVFTALYLIFRRV